MTNPSALQIRLFGPGEVRIDGHTLPPLRSRKTLWLLALLTLRQDCEVSREWLAGTLWPESTQAQALASLRVTLNDLRAALGPQVTRLNAPTARTLLFDLAGTEVDVTEFDATVASKENTALETAVRLYRGPLLEGCAEEWVMQERLQRAERYLQALSLLATQAMERADFAPAIRYLRLSLAEDPYQESVCRLLMQALADSGDYAAVLLTYRDFRLRLRRDLNTEPSAETTALFQTLRDMARRVPSVRGDAAPIAEATPALIGILPLPLTRFIGRKAAIREIRGLLSQSRLVTLTGTGGIGKTRLAIQVAGEAATRFSEGVWFVDLAALTDVTLVPQAIASTLGIRDAPGQSLLETVCAALAAKRLLLVLDNCEHLRAGCATTASTLLQRCPQLVVLATSRQALGLAGEAAWRVPSLSVPEENVRETHSTPAALLQFEGAQLFADRAAHHAPRFEVTARNAPALARICRQLDGIALALELAAARVKVLTVEQIAERLDHRFRLLTAGKEEALPRHRTLRAMLDWSYELLAPEEQTLLRRLAVFAGGAALEAVAQVCGLDEYAALDLISSLVDKSLVTVEESGDQARYRLLETVRQYGRDRLEEAAERDALRWRHLDYFRRLAEEIEPQLQGAEQGKLLERLEQEHDNLRVALQFTVEAGAKGLLPESRNLAPPVMVPEAVEAGLRLAWSLWRFWWVRGHNGEGRAHLAAALAADTKKQPTQARARALSGAGVLAWAQGDCREAQTLLEESLGISQANEDRRSMVSALGNLAIVAYEQGDYERSYRRFEENAVTLRELGDLSGVSVSLHNQGSVAAHLKDFAQARRLLEESLAIRRELGDIFGVSSSLGNLGNVVADLGDYALAYAYQRESLTIRREMGDKFGIAYSLEAIASLATALKQCERAARLWAAAEALREVSGSPLPGSERAEMDRQIAEAREFAGEEAFATAWAEGRALPLEQAIAYALEGM